MNRTEFWKNFNLGDELDISGTFIYNGLRCFHVMRTIEHTDDVFDFLYNLSVGFERLLKIAVVFLEHNDSANQAELEKSLITHNHGELLKRARKHTSIKLSTVHNDLLQLLSKFYKTYRYDRFSLSSVDDFHKEKEKLLEFINKHLKADLDIKQGFVIQNDNRYRRFIRKNVLEISSTLYGIISNRSRALNLYTYELRYGSKASAVFQRKIDMFDEDVLWKELLIFFMNTKSTSAYLEFMRDITPLDFDPGRIAEYLECFKSDAAKSSVMDEIEHHYYELESHKKSRIECLELIGNPNVFFDSQEDV